MNPNELLNTLEKILKIGDAPVGEYWGCTITTRTVKDLIDYIKETEENKETINQIMSGEWVDTDKVEKAFNIDFSKGMEVFEFSRTAEWNPAPLNGQKITTKFKLVSKKG
jgi:hypothetical protein